MSGSEDGTITSGDEGSGDEDEQSVDSEPEPSSEEEDAVTQTRPGTRPAAQTLKEWLTNEYGADLSAVTAISGVPSNVTGKFLFSRTLKSLYLPTIFAHQCKYSNI